MAKKSGIVRVTATRNLDLLNAGEVATVDRDAQVERLLTSGDLIEVDEAGVPVDEHHRQYVQPPVIPSQSPAVTGQTTAQQAEGAGRAAEQQQAALRNTRESQTVESESKR